MRRRLGTQGHRARTSPVRILSTSATETFTIAEPLPPVPSSACTVMV